jgi:hypothetical protein
MTSCMKNYTFGVLVHAGRIQVQLVGPKSNVQHPAVLQLRLVTVAVAVAPWPHHGSTPDAVVLDRKKQVVYIVDVHC